MSFNVFNLSEAAVNPFNFCVRLIKISILYLFPVVSAGLFVCFSWRGYSSPTRAPHLPQVSVSGSSQTRPLFYPVRQLHHVCRVDAEEDVKVFRPLRPGLDPPEIVVLFLCPERAFHRSRPHSGKLHHYVVQQLVVRQWPCRIYYHVAEYLVVYVDVQLFQQFRTAESRVHLQEHQGNFPFRREERPASQLRPHAFPCQTEVLCHLAEREQFRILPNSLFSKVE